MTRDATDEERNWFIRLSKVLRAMPKTVEVEVHNNHVQMNEKGARDAAFARCGDGDNAESIMQFSVIGMRLYPVSESV